MKTKLQDSRADQASGLNHPRQRTGWKYVLMAVLIAAFWADARGQTNSWKVGTGKWETSGNWSSGAPTNSNAINFITNAAMKMVTIDAATTNAANVITLTISNLVLSAPVNTTNTLQLSDTGTNAPLHILNGFTINSGGALLVSNSALLVDAVLSNGFVINGGVTLLTNASVVATNPAASTIIGSFVNGNGSLTMNGGFVSLYGLMLCQGVSTTGTVWMSDGLLAATFIDIGDQGVGQMTVSNGTVLANSSVYVGRNSSGRGTLTIAGGASSMSGLEVGQIPASARGTVWMTGGQLVVTNLSSSIILLGEQGSGEMTVSNGMVLSRNASVGSQPGGRGTLTVAGGTNTFLGTLTVGFQTNATGAVWVTGGQLVVNATRIIGASGVGQMTVSNGSCIGHALTVASNAGSQGTLTLAGGTNTVSLQFVIGDLANSTGAVWVSGGQLAVTNAITRIGSTGVGQMTVSNGTVLSSNVVLGAFSGSQGTLTMAGGTNMLSDELRIGANANATGAVWVTGGELVVTNYYLTAIGSTGVGQLTVSNGTYLAGSVLTSHGTLTVAGGTTTLSIQLVTGFETNATSAVWMTGGRLVTTNSIYPTIIGNSGVGQMTVSNGTWLGSGAFIGNLAGAQGTLTLAGGTTTFLSYMVLGSFDCSATGNVNIVGGELDITNAFASAILEVRSGTLTLSSGTLRVDTFVMTNACGHFTHTGGTLILNSIPVLDPNRDDDGDGIPNGYEQSHGLDPLDPINATKDSDGDGLTDLQEYLAGTDPHNSASFFGITSITKVSTNILVTWQTGPGETNALQRTSGVGGNFSTNNFAAIFTVTNTVGTTTNYLDIGAATNVPSLFYRVRLVP